MKTPESNELSDGYLEYSGGRDGKRDPTQIAPNQIANAINVTVRDKFPRPRPPWIKHPLVFTEGDPAPETIFNNVGFFQHGSWYRPDDGPERLIAVISGRTYVIFPSQGFTVQEITPYRLDFPLFKDPNPSLNLRGWSAQGEQFWVYNDGGTLPLIYDGASSRRATPDELKPGTVIQYVQGRFWYSLPNALAFRAGDLVYSDSGTALYRYRDAILKETENSFLNEGGDFGIPSGAGRIHSMRPFSILDTSQGQGPLQVGTERGFFSVNTPVDRTVWKDLQYPIQTVSLIGHGPLGQQSTVNVNGDLFYRSSDGIRSFILARRDFGTWGNRPMSNEVNDILDKDRTDFLENGSGVEFDGRLLMTCSPMWSYRGIYNRGLIALDFDPVTSMAQVGTPAYDGLWTGLRILSVVRTDTTCYIFVLGKGDKIEVWELLKQGLFDNLNVPIQWSIETRAFQYQSPFNMKRLMRGDLKFDQLFGNLNWSASWKSDQYPCWFTWESGNECGNYCDTVPVVASCTPSQPLQPQYRPKRKLSQPPDSCNTTVGNRTPMFFDHQVRLQFTGQARLKQIRFRAAPVPESEYDDCPTLQECSDLRCCTPETYSYLSDP